MIQSFQKFSQSRIAKIFLAIVALSFMAFFGGGNWFRPHDPNAVIAEIGSTVLSRYEFAEKFQKEMQRFTAQTGEPLSREEILHAGLPQAFLRQLINNTLLTLEAESLGLTVSDEMLRNRIQSMALFQNEQGRFDRSHFIQVLRSLGLSEDAFIDEVRSALMREQLVDALIVGASIPEEMVNRLFDIQYQHRQASMFLVSLKDIPLPSPPSEDVLEAFYKAHQKDFETPELRSFTLLIIDPALIAREISVTEDEIKATYEAKSDIYANKSLDTVKPLIIADIQKEKSITKTYEMTQELDDKIAGGSTFEELAPSFKGVQLVKLVLVDAQGRDEAENISKNLPENKEFAQEILQTGFGLEEASDSPFTQARNGAYYAIRADQVKPATIPSFAEIQNRVLKKWSKDEQLKAAQAKAESYVISLNQGERKISSMTLLPSLSLSEPSPSVSNEVKSLIFSLRPGRAGLVPVSEGFAVVLLNAIIPPTPKEKEEKLTSFKDILLKKYQNDILISYINSLRVHFPVKVNGNAIKALFTQ